VRTLTSSRQCEGSPNGVLRTPNTINKRVCTQTHTHTHTHKHTHTQSPNGVLRTTDTIKRERLKPGMATSIHVRGNGVGSTLLRKKADPAHDWVDNRPEVAEGETVRVIATEGAFSLVRLASGAQGFIWSKYLRAAGAPVKLNDVAGAPVLLRDPGRVVPVKLNEVLKVTTDLLKQPQPTPPCPCRDKGDQLVSAPCGARPVPPRGRDAGLRSGRRHPRSCNPSFTVLYRRRLLRCAGRKTAFTRPGAQRYRRNTSNSGQITAKTCRIAGVSNVFKLQLSRQHAGAGRLRVENHRSSQPPSVLAVSSAMN